MSTSKDASKNSSKLQRFRKIKDDPMALDTFLYACLELENIYQVRQSEKVLGGASFESLVLNSSEETIPETFPEALQELISWYKAQRLSHLTQNILNYESAKEVIPIVLSFKYDLNALLKKFDKARNWYFDFEKSSDYPEWNLLTEKISQSFPEWFAMRLTQFLAWNYSDVQEKNYELGERPPVGRYTPPHFIRMKTPNFQKKADVVKFPPRDEKAQEELVKECLAEVSESIQKLKESEELEVLALKPRNSYLRRLQHQEVVQAGLFSYSEGEADKRAVVISKKPVDSKENS